MLRQQLTKQQQQSEDEFLLSNHDNEDRFNNQEEKSKSSHHVENRSYGSLMKGTNENENDDNTNTNNMNGSGTNSNDANVNDNDNADIMSSRSEDETDEEDDDDDGSEFSYGSQYNHDNNYEEDEDYDDFDEEDRDFHLSRSNKEYRNNTRCCLSFPCCGENSKSEKKRKKRRRRRRNNADRRDSIISYEESESEKRWKTLFKPVLSPMIKVYQVAKDAFILITNVDDVWDSPALNDQRRHSNDDLLSRSRSDSFNSSTSFRGSTYDGRAPFFSTDGLHHGHGYDHVSISTGNIIRGEPNVIAQHVTLRHKVGVLFWFFVLATAYGLERGLFKVMIDRMGPFRMVIGAEFVMAVHALILASWMLIRIITCGRNNVKVTAMIPLTDVGLMAILDSIQIMLAVVSGSRVAPILTSVLVHFTIPVSTFFNMVLFQNQGDNENNYTHRHSPQLLFGSTLILISSILALSPAILTLIYPAFFSAKNVMANRTAWNTILFTMSCIPGAISQIYKEQTLASFAQPVDSNLLNMLLSLFSFAFTFIISPVVFTLQGLADTPSTPEDGSDLKVESWIHQYPSKEVSQNFSDSFQCLIGKLNNNVQIRSYPEEAHCDFAYGLVLLYVFSIIAINYAVDKICNAGAIKIMHRGISAGIILSVIMMVYYQIFVDDEDYGLFPNFYHMSCAVVLVMGSEVFHRVNLEKISFETEYPQVVDLYDRDIEFHS